MEFDFDFDVGGYWGPMADGLCFPKRTTGFWSMKERAAIFFFFGILQLYY